MKQNDFIKLRKAGELAAKALKYIEDKIIPGVTTNMIDKTIKKFLKDNNAYSAPLFYRGYPKSVCTSVNHVVCHGIPCDKELKNGDILNIDVTSYLDGFHGVLFINLLFGAKSCQEANCVCACIVEIATTAENAEPAA